MMEYCWRIMGKTVFPINGEGNLNDGNRSSIALPGSDFTFCIFSSKECARASLLETERHVAQSPLTSIIPGKTTLDNRQCTTLRYINEPDQDQQNHLANHSRYVSNKPLYVSVIL